MSNNGTDQDESYLDKAIGGAGAFKDIAAGAKRVPFDYSKIPTDFQNGEHIDNPGGGPTVTIDSKAGDNKSSGAGEVELIHFGRVYIDSEAKFAHAEYDDNANIDMAGITGARAGMHRAALMRETLLQAGYLHALRWAMDEASKTPPGNQKDGLQMMDQLLGMVGDLVGGDAAGQLQASTLDLNPLISQCNAIGSRLNQSSIRYFHLHKAGRDLHELRCKYRAFLDAQNKTTPSPAAKPPALLGGLPLIGDALKEIPFVGDALKWGDKIMACSFQLVGRLSVEMHLKMEPSINAAARDITLDAIRNRRAPVFKPWWKYPPPPPDDDPDPNSNGGGGDALSFDAVDAAKDALNPTLQGIDREVKTYTSIFQREDKTTPGDAFIDMAFFLNPQGSPLDRSEKMADYGAQALARVIGGEEGADTSFGMPEIVTKIASYIFRLVSEFVRAVYNKLLVMGDGWFADEASGLAEIAEAGRTHLLVSLTNWPLKELDWDKYINMVNQEIPSLSGGDPIVLSTRNLFENLRDMLIAELAFMDPAVEFATTSFYALLNRVHTDLTDVQTRSMEVYLALIPTLHATMFRNLLLPFWEVMQTAVKGALSTVLAPVMNELGASGFMGDFYNKMDTAQQVAQRAQKAIDLISGPGGVGTHNYKDVLDLGDGLNNPNTAAAFDRGNVNGVGAANPFGRRNAKVTGVAIGQAQRDSVEPDLKWNHDAAVNEAPPTTEPPPPAPAPQNNGGN